MSLRTLTVVLSDCLEDLSEQNFGKFVGRLRDRRAEPRVKRNRVEGKSYYEVTEVMVSTFTEVEAWRVAVEILKSIGCGEEAKNLAEDAAEILDSGPPGISSGPSGSAEVQHFIDKNRAALIERVTNMGPILDQLFDRGIIQSEFYDKTRALSVHQDQMRALYSGPLKAGRKCKDEFYEILKSLERYLIQELNGN